MRNDILFVKRQIIFRFTDLPICETTDKGFEAILLSPRTIYKQDKTAFEPRYDKTNKMACAPSEDSDQPGHPPSLIRVFAVRSMDS